MRIAYRDPEHVSERLTLYASQRLAAPSRDWAERVRRERSDTPPARVHRLLIFGGFLSAPGEEPAGDERPRGGCLRALAGLAVATAIWLTTWVLPVTFMLAMAWACGSHTRQLGRRALLLYEGNAATPEAEIAAADVGHDRGHERRQILWIAMKVGLPGGTLRVLTEERARGGPSSCCTRDWI